MILADNDIYAQLACLPGWRHEAGQLVRRYEFRDWSQALAFANALGYFAERAGDANDGRSARIDVQVRRQLKEPNRCYWVTRTK